MAYKNGNLTRVPVIHRRLKEAAPRSGFFEPKQVEAVRRPLARGSPVVVAIAYTFGWRTQSEVLPLERRHLDVGTRTLRLDQGMTKNDDGRVVYLTSELRTAQVKRVKALGVFGSLGLDLRILYRRRGF